MKLFKWICIRFNTDRTIRVMKRAFSTTLQVSEKDGGFYQKPVDFNKVNKNLLPTVVIVGRPNVGKSALFNRWVSLQQVVDIKIFMIMFLKFKLVLTP